MDDLDDYIATYSDEERQQLAEAEAEIERMFTQPRRRPATISPERKPYTPPAWPGPPRTLAPLKRDDDDSGPTLQCPHYSGMGVVNQ